MMDNNVNRCESCGDWVYFPEHFRLMGLALICKLCTRMDKSK